MELVVLNIGLDIGVLSPAMFTIMVLMALITTFMTAPLLEWIYVRHLPPATKMAELQVPAGPVLVKEELSRP
jgi:Kef-type K+ transport system membrane component KefB